MAVSVERDKVIRVLQNIHDNGDFGADLIAATGWALELLREQEPVEAIKENLAGSVYQIHRCGECRSWLRIGDKYCSYCGRAVKSSD